MNFTNFVRQQPSYSTTGNPSMKEMHKKFDSFNQLKVIFFAANWYLAED